MNCTKCHNELQNVKDILFKCVNNHINFIINNISYKTLPRSAFALSKKIKNDCIFINTINKKCLL